jgi:amino acid transporter
MARDNQLPFSKPLARVSPSLHTPLWTCIVIAVLAAIPFIQFTGAGTIATAATAMIYFSYFLGNIAILRARLRGWPKTDAPFKLRRWGLVVNILGLLYGAAMIVNFAWPPAAGPTATGPRLVSNPRPDQTVLNGVQQLNFHIGFLNRIPILWTVFVVIALIGVIYYAAAGARKDVAPIQVPADDDAPLEA